MDKEIIKGTVIIVEDDMIFSMIVRRIIENLGFKVVANADNSEDAIERVIEHLPDIVIMDVSLKGSTDGIETIRRINSVRYVPVIYISGHSGMHNINRAKKSTGFVDYLVKPISRDDMVLPLEKARKKSGDDYMNQSS